MGFRYLYIAVVRRACGSGSCTLNMSMNGLSLVNEIPIQCTYRKGDPNAQTNFHCSYTECVCVCVDNIVFYKGLRFVERLIEPTEPSLEKMVDEVSDKN